MNKNKGSMRFSSVIIMTFIIYGGFCLFKLISANIAVKDTNNEIKNIIGRLRSGPDSIPKIETAIEDYLISLSNAEKIIFKEKHALRVNLENQEIIYSVEFDMEVNYLLFKSIKNIQLQDKMPSYGM
jgi:hypothetical protein